MSDQAERNLSMEAALWKALAKEPSTFGDLWPLANEAIGQPRHDHHAAGYRFTDRWLQKGRRAGLLTVKRVGKLSVWTITPENDGGA